MWVLAVRNPTLIQCICQAFFQSRSGALSDPVTCEHDVFPFSSDHWLNVGHWFRDPRRPGFLGLCTAPRFVAVQMVGGASRFLLKVPLKALRLAECFTLGVVGFRAPEYANQGPLVQNSFCKSASDKRWNGFCYPCSRRSRVGVVHTIVVRMPCVPKSPWLGSRQF